MARRSKNPAASSPPPAPRSVAHALRIAVAIVALGAAVGLGWHRTRDPARIWARTLERIHSDRFEQRFVRCFGGADAESLRRVEADIRAGRWRAPFQACTGPTLTETVIAPLDVITGLADPPGGIDAARARERISLDRLRGTLTQLERVTYGLDRSHPVPEATRDALATALEDVAVEVQNERRTLTDLVDAAESAARWW